jgi:transcriptional regulator with XRE-family HTH domain
MDSDFGEKLRLIRVVRGYNQEYVADELGISVRSYQRYENSQTKVSVKFAMKVAKFYNLTLDELSTYGEKIVAKNDSKEQLFKGTKVVISVELDGKKDNLDMWIKRLTAINEVI